MYKATSAFILAVFIVLPGIAQAMPAISCHCFQNREFDPRRPAAADDYLLATTFNSFQALALGIDKKSIVRAKMSGQTSEDIWLRHWLRKKTGLSVAEIERQHGAADSWLALVQRSGIADFSNVASTQPISSDRQLAEAVARAEMVRCFAIEESKLTELGRKGASLKEMALSLFLAALTEESAADIFAKVHGEGMSWGLVAQKAGITFSSIEMRMQKLVQENES